MYGACNGGSLKSAFSAACVLYGRAPTRFRARRPSVTIGRFPDVGLRVGVRRGDVEQRLVDADLDGDVAVAAVVHDERRVFPRQAALLRPTGAHLDQRADDHGQQQKARDYHEGADLDFQPPGLLVERARARARQVASGLARETLVRLGAGAPGARRVARDAGRGPVSGSPRR